MQISVQCPNGHRMEVSDSFAGSKMECPICRECLLINEAPANLAKTTHDQKNGQAEKRVKSVSLPTALGVILIGLGLISMYVWYSVRDTLPVMGGSEYTDRIQQDPTVQVIQDPTVPVIIDESQLQQSTAVNSESATTMLPPIIDTDKDVDTSPVPRLQSQPPPVSRDYNIKKLSTDGIATLYKFPEPIWSSAYDASTGILAIIQEDKFVRFFSVDDLLQGKTEPKAILDCPSTPVSICLKQIDQSRFFVFCSTEFDADITFVDTTTLNIAKTIKIGSDGPFCFVACSENPDDPYLYLRRFTPRLDEGILVRQNIQEQQTQLINVPFIDFQITSDGEWILAKYYRPNSSEIDYFYGTWKDIEKKDFFYYKNPIVEASSTEGSSLRSLGKSFALESIVLQPIFPNPKQVNLVKIFQAEYEPLASFKSLPLCVGVSQNALALGSSTTGMKLIETPLPASLNRRDNPKIDTEVKWGPRYKMRFGSVIGRINIDAYADDSRKLSIASIDDHLVILPIGKLNFPTSPLDFEFDFPKKITAGETIEIAIPESVNYKDISFEIKTNGNKSFIPEKIQATSSELEVCKLRWCPEQLFPGRQNIEIIGNYGQESRKWNWSVEVEFRLIREEFDFYVMGIDGSSTSELALVWGIVAEDAPLRYGVRRDSPTPLDRSILGIYDTVNKRMQAKVTVPYQIETAILHPTGIYAVSSNAPVMLPNDRVHLGALSRYELNSLKKLDSLPLTTTPYHRLSVPKFTIVAQGSNQLAVLAERIPQDQAPPIVSGSDHLVRIPEMTLVAQPRSPNFALDGFVKSGPIQDGILWDESFTIPKLLLYPYLFNSRVSHKSVPLRRGNVWIDTKGIFASSYSIGAMGNPSGLFLYESNTFVRSTGERIVVAQTNANNPESLFSQILTMPFPSDRKFFFSQPSDFLSYPDLSKSKESQALCRTKLYATSDGGVYWIPRKGLPNSPDSFAFEEKQDHFVVNAGKNVQWKYSVPQATKYKLSVYFQAANIGHVYPGQVDENYSIHLESNDGIFEYTADPKKIIEALLKQLSYKDKMPEKITEASIIEQIQAIEPIYRKLTGRIPTTLPVIATAVVTAESEIPEQKAGLLHAYLVEVPIEEIFRELTNLRVKAQSK